MVWTLSQHMGHSLAFVDVKFFLYGHIAKKIQLYPLFGAEGGKTEKIDEEN